MAISLNDVQRGYDAWAAKPHNAKWVRKIDGTPIANDIVVNIFETLKDDRATAAEATVTDLQEALEPFARAAERIDTYYAEETGDQTPLDNGVIISTLIIGDDLSLFLLGDLRRARTALTTIRENNP